MNTLKYGEIKGFIYNLMEFHCDNLKHDEKDMKKLLHKCQKKIDCSVEIVKIRKNGTVTDLKVKKDLGL